MPEAIPTADPTPAELQMQIEDLRRELSVALDAARDAELSAGLLRGELAEMRVQLGRARQEQEWALTARSVRVARWRHALRSRFDTLRRRVSAQLRR
jgi:hypothetical protein